MNRIYHTWDEWECYPAGFYENSPQDRALSDDDCRLKYRALLADRERFTAALHRVITEWPNSCEHYLTNERMNRIAWLGQASLCIAEGIPSRFRGGYMMLDEHQQIAADLMAFDALNKWLCRNGYPELETLADAGSKTQMDLY